MTEHREGPDGPVRLVMQLRGVDEDSRALVAHLAARLAAKGEPDAEGWFRTGPEEFNRSAVDEDGVPVYEWSLLVPGKGGDDG